MITGAILNIQQVGASKVHWLADLMHEGFKVDVLAVQELNLPVVAADNFVEILGQRKIYVYFGGVDNNLYRCAILSTARGASVDRHERVARACYEFSCKGEFCRVVVAFLGF